MLRAAFHPTNSPANYISMYRLERNWIHLEQSSIPALNKRPAIDLQIHLTT